MQVCWNDRRGYFDYDLAIDAFGCSAAAVFRPAGGRYSRRHFPSGGLRCGDYRHVADLWTPAVGAVTVEAAQGIVLVQVPLASVASDNSNLSGALPVKPGGMVPVLEIKFVCWARKRAEFVDALRLCLGLKSTMSLGFQLPAYDIACTTHLAFNLAWRARRAGRFLGIQMVRGGKKEGPRFRGSQFQQCRSLVFFV